MTQFYSRNDVNYSGDVYSIPFKYIHKKEVKVYIDDELWTKWHFLNTNQLTLDEVPEGIGYNNIVSVRRETDIKEKVVTYDNNSLLNKENLNKSQDQLIYAVQEIYDNNIQFQIDTDEVIETNKQEVLEIQEAFEQETQQQLLQNKTEIENRVIQFENEVNNTIDVVKEAAHKVNQLEEAVNTAVTAANTAAEQAEIAANKTEETTELVEQFTENIDSKISTNNENMQSVLAETEAVLQEAKNTLDDTLKKSQITNCLLEVPQNIKLELNNGTLTLKAGSKVTIPNGAGVFDEVTISQDISIASGVGQKLLMVASSGTSVTSVNLSKAVSGATDSLVGTTYHAWYDTTNNVVLRYGTEANTPSSRCSFPIAIVTFIDSTTVSSIDQIFNGMGYIGSTIWVDKGVKFLVPNGRNADGTLKNIEVVTNKVSTKTANWYTDYVMFIDRYSFCQYVRKDEHYFEQDDMPHEPLSLYDVWYSPKDNVYRSDKNSTSWEQYYVARIGEFGSGDNYSVTNFQPKQPVQLAQYDEFTELKQNTLNKQQITNCITEVPQNIKLELKEGTLTLKKGSKVTIPNGAGKFEELVLNYDKTIAGTAGTNQKFIFVRQDGGLVIGDTIAKTGSGSTDSFAGQAWHVWYDTTNNKIFRYTSDGSTPAYQMSFPIALVSAVDGVVTSIDQVFNGFGYIGRHAWFDKGIKYLFGIKRNTDGTIENKELITNFRVWETHNWTEGRLACINENGTHTDIMPSRILKGLRSEMPSEVSNNSFHMYICTDTLETFYTNTQVANWKPQSRVVPIFEYGAVAPSDGNTLTYFKPYPPFRAVDYSEFLKETSPIRFDGQWVYKTLTVTTSTATRQTLSLSSYLPNDGYIYEVLINGKTYCANEVNGYVGTDIFPNQGTHMDFFCNTNARQQCNTFLKPVGSGRYITWYSNGTFASLQLYVLGYRRVGTNI